MVVTSYVLVSNSACLSQKHKRKKEKRKKIKKLYIYVELLINFLTGLLLRGSESLCLSQDQIAFICHLFLIVSTLVFCFKKLSRKPKIMLMRFYSTFI